MDCEEITKYGRLSVCIEEDAEEYRDDKKQETQKADIYTDIRRERKEPNI